MLADNLRGLEVDYETVKESLRLVLEIQMEMGDRRADRGHCCSHLLLGACEVILDIERENGYRIGLQ